MMGGESAGGQAHAEKRSARLPLPSSILPKN